MNKNIIYGALYVAFFLGLAYVIPKFIKPKNVKPTPLPVSQQVAAPQKQSPTTSQNPEDIIAGLYPNPINNTASQEGFKIKSILVENNTDSTGLPTSDHLELTLANVSSSDLSNFEVYYTITDTTNNTKEGYYKKLDNFTLKAGMLGTIHFDNGTEPGHYSVNKNSLYYKSSNALQFNVIVSTPGYRIDQAQATKAAGGAETKD